MTLKALRNKQKKTIIMKNFKGKMYTIHSGNVAQVGWEYNENKKIGVMRVIFKNGRTYHYYPVTNDKFGEIFIASSKGKWFTKNIFQNKLIEYKEIELKK